MANPPRKRPAARPRAPRRSAAASNAQQSIGPIIAVVLVLAMAGVVIARAWPEFTVASAAPSATSAPVAAAPLPTATRAPAAAQDRAEATPTTAAAAKPTAAAVANTATPAAAATRAPATQSTSTPPPAPTAQPAAVKPAVSPQPTTAAPAAPPPAAATDKVVSLTFDAGADRGYAEDILDYLLEQHIHASFGMTGQWAKAYPDLVRRMGAEGHHVINHSMTHRSFTGVSDNLGGLGAAQRRAELDQADAVIAPLIGHTTKPWYRLPYGDDDPRVAADVAPAGYTHKAGWTLDSWGWRGLVASDIVARCLGAAAPNVVYIFHVGAASQDGPALPRLVTALRERGFGFVPMDEL